MLPLANELLGAKKSFPFVVGGDGFPEVNLVGEKSATVEMEMVVRREGPQRRFRERKKKEDCGVALARLEARRAGG